MKKWVEQQLGELTPVDMYKRGDFYIIDNKFKVRYCVSSTSKCVTLILGNEWVSMEVAQSFSFEESRFDMLGYSKLCSVYALMFMYSAKYMIPILDGMSGKLIGGFACKNWYTADGVFAKPSEELLPLYAKYRMLKGVSLVGLSYYDIIW